MPKSPLRTFDPALSISRSFTRLKPLSVKEVRERPPRRYLIKGLLGVGEMSIWYGDPGCGKSFMALEVARCVAMGKSWFGRATIQGPVLYVMCEGGGGVGKRIAAMRVAHGLNDDTQLYIIPANTRLLSSSDDTKAVIHWAKQFKTKLIVIDTLNRAMSGGEENSSKDMGDFIASCDEIREETGAHIAIVHHNGSNKDKKGRGHTSLEGAADTMVFIQKHQEGNIAKVTKNKDDEDGWSIGFQLKVVEIGIDEDGSPVSSCAVVSAIVSTTVVSSRLTGDRATAWDALNDVMIRSGKSVYNRCGIPEGIRCVTIRDWRQEFYARASDKPSQEAKQKAFSRSMAGLRDMGKIAYRDDLAWIVINGNLPGQDQT